MKNNLMHKLFYKSIKNNNYDSLKDILNKRKITYKEIFSYSENLRIVLNVSDLEYYLIYNSNKEIILLFLNYNNFFNEMLNNGFLEKMITSNNKDAVFIINYILNKSNYDKNEIYNFLKNDKNIKYIKKEIFECIFDYCGEVSDKTLNVLLLRKVIMENRQDIFDYIYENELFKKNKYIIYLTVEFENPYFFNKVSKTIKIEQNNNKLLKTVINNDIEYYFNKIIKNKNVIDLYSANKKTFYDDIESKNIEKYKYRLNLISSLRNF